LFLDLTPMPARGLPIASVYSGMAKLVEDIADPVIAKYTRLGSYPDVAAIVPSQPPAIATA
jgi:hypothetical protein